MGQLRRSWKKLTSFRLRVGDIIGMHCGVKRMLQKMGKRYDSDVRWHASTGDKKYDKVMSKSIAKDKAQLMGMTNKYEIWKS